MTVPLENIDFCETIHLACNQDKRIFYFVAPLAPFLDPASPAFENPELHGYKKFCHTLEDHRKAICQPSWKHMLSYETKDMTRDDIVNSTYESAQLLNEFKLKYGLIDEDGYLEIKWKIEKSINYIEKIDYVLSLPKEQQPDELAKIREEIEELNKYSICGKNELKWEVQKNYANFFSLTLVGLNSSYEDYANKIRHLVKPQRRQQFQLNPNHRKMKI